MNQQEYKLMQIIQKVEAFRGLQVPEFRRLLTTCRSASYDSGEQVYVAGQPSEDMFIVLSGALIVTGRSGEKLGEVKAGSSLGEMGMFTGEPRSANVHAAEKTSGMKIVKQQLYQVMKEEPTLRSTVLQNMVDMLSDRMIAANRKIEELSRRIHQLEAVAAGSTTEEQAADEVIEEAEEGVGEEDSDGEGEKGSDG